MSENVLKTAVKLNTFFRISGPNLHLKHEIKYKIKYRQVGTYDGCGIVKTTWYGTQIILALPEHFPTQLLGGQSVINCRNSINYIISKKCQ